MHNRPPLLVVEPLLTVLRTSTPPEGFAGMCWSRAALYAAEALARGREQARTAGQLLATAPLFPSPWTHDLGAQVACAPYPTMTPAPELYRVVGRSWGHYKGLQHVVQYVLEPWQKSGRWMDERPLVADAPPATAWQETPQEPPL
jgi:hypothetical protein